MTPDPVMRKRLEVALWVFSFNLPDTFNLRGTTKLLIFYRRNAWKKNRAFDGLACKLYTGFIFPPENAGNQDAEFESIPFFVVFILVIVRFVDLILDLRLRIIRAFFLNFGDFFHVRR